ncbi:MAG: hypothetical protein BWY19_00551 [bacterium ADurb.Bin212]|nr:MAG: hypothetical protein BWY19_00551 [bacterium ADurb.Bin212]
MPLFRVDFSDHFGELFHSEVVEASDAGPALGWAVLAANQKQVRLSKGCHIKAHEVLVGGKQLSLKFEALPEPQKPSRVVRPARLVCGFWPNISGECEDCNNPECERSTVNRRT